MSIVEGQVAPAGGRAGRVVAAAVAAAAMAWLALAGGATAGDLVVAFWVEGVAVALVTPVRMVMSRGVVSREDLHALSSGHAAGVARGLRFRVGQPVRPQIRCWLAIAWFRAQWLVLAPTFVVVLWAANFSSGLGVGDPNRSRNPSHRNRRDQTRDASATR